MPHSYTNYDIMSKTYTSLRKPVGTEDMLKFYRENETIELGKQKLLDTGCGTGNYMLVFAPEFGSVHCTDYNEGMLFEAKKNKEDFNKVAKDAVISNVTFSQDSCMDLKRFESGSYDAVCNNQVVHHFRPDNDFQDLRDTVYEFARVLKSGGRVTVNWSPPDNVQKSFCYAELIPVTFAKWAKRAPTSEKMVQLLEEAGFTNIEVKPLYDEILFVPELYFNPRNMIDIDRYKCADSLLGMGSKEELNSMKEKIEKMDKEGTLDKWFAEREEIRKATGQTCTVFAIKK